MAEPGLRQSRPPRAEAPSRPPEGRSADAPPPAPPPLTRSCALGKWGARSLPNVSLCIDPLSPVPTRASLEDCGQSGRRRLSRALAAPAPEHGARTPRKPAASHLVGPAGGRSLLCGPRGHPAMGPAGGEHMSRTRTPTPGAAERGSFRLGGCTRDPGVPEAEGLLQWRSWRAPSGPEVGPRVESSHLYSDFPSWGPGRTQPGPPNRAS